MVPVNGGVGADRPLSRVHVNNRYSETVVILGYRDRRTEQFADGEFIAAFQGFESQAAKRLSILNAAPSLDTLRVLRSNRLEALKGRREGQYSIRTNWQRRIRFTWSDGKLGPTDVEIVDYH